MPEICVGTDSSATQSGANISYSPPAGWEWTETKFRSCL